MKKLEGEPVHPSPPQIGAHQGRRVRLVNRRTSLEIRRLFCRSFRHRDYRYVCAAFSFGLELDATQRWEFETRGRRDYLLYFFTDIVLANFQSRFPGSRIEGARYLSDLLEGTMVAFALLPGGSNFAEPPSMLGGPAPDPVIAKRGSLLFVRHRHVYVVSLELSERATQRSTYNLTTTQEDDQLTNRLTAVVGRMTFTDDRPREP